MSTPPNAGGPAFPQAEYDHGMNVASGGMTLRDYFAAKALTGLIHSKNEGWPPETAAVYSYIYADAMLAERAKGREDKP